MYASYKNGYRFESMGYLKTPKLSKLRKFYQFWFPFENIKTDNNHKD